ncbi:MAG TPA: hypothetical protein VN922_23220, partial [Bacteroidia bacterium]|nr:hypothetical protein [Bacteroidia bacterium]
STELLKKEKYFFENNVVDYSNLDGKERNKLLVERVESIVSAETSPNTLQFTNHPTRTTKVPTKNNRVPSGISGAFLIFRHFRDEHVDIFSDYLK